MLPLIMSTEIAYWVNSLLALVTVRSSVYGRPYSPRASVHCKAHGTKRDFPPKKEPDREPLSRRTYLVFSLSGLSRRGQLNTVGGAMYAHIPTCTKHKLHIWMMSTYGRVVLKCWNAEPTNSGRAFSNAGWISTLRKVHCIAPRNMTASLPFNLAGSLLFLNHALK